MKFELKFITSRDHNLSILEGKGPHKPSDTNDNTFRFESFVKTVKKDSMENLSERVSDEFPTTVNSVTWPLKHTMLRGGGREQKLVKLVHP